MKNSYLVGLILLLLFPLNSISQSISNNKMEADISIESFNPVINKWLRGEKIKSEFQGESDSRFQPYLIDVNGDGKKELAIRNDCAAVGNC
jgi:hypothetical protein